MSPKPIIKRSYNEAPCNACYPPQRAAEKHGQVVETLNKKHLITTKHEFITTIRKDQIDSLKLKPQNDPSDDYYLQREEYNRKSKLNNRKPWLDARFHKDNKDYIYYCNYCNGFILNETLSKHEQRNSHWQRFQFHFMNDLKDLLSKNDIKLDKSLFEFTQKYTGINLDDARDFFSNHLGQMRTKDRTSNSVSKLDDSGIDASIADTSFDCNQNMVTSTPKKCEKNTVPPKNVPKKKVYVKDMHTSTEICKISYKDTIRMYYQNVNSIKSDEKMNNFIDASVRDYDVVIFTETWLEEGQELKYNMNVFNEYYDVYRCDRSGSVKSRGGGTLIAVSAKLYSDPVLLKGFNHLECICVQFLNKNKSIFLYCAYIRPDSAIEIYEEHFKAIQSIKLGKNDILIVVGDFNLPNIIWNSKDNVTFLPKNNDSVRETRLQSQKLTKLEEFQTKCNLHQLCNDKNPKGNVLDLVFSNDIDHISIAKLPGSQKPMSKPDERHAPPFEIIFDSVKHVTKKVEVK